MFMYNLVCQNDIRLYFSALVLENNSTVIYIPALCYRRRRSWVVNNLESCIVGSSSQQWACVSHDKTFDYLGGPWAWKRFRRRTLQ